MKNSVTSHDMTIFACVILYLRWKAGNFMNYLQPLCLQALQCGIITGWFKFGFRSPKFIWAPCAQLYSLAETPQHPPPAFGLICEGAIGQPRQTTPLCDPLGVLLPSNTFPKPLHIMLHVANENTI
jgi:hypothetical protein